MVWSFVGRTDKYNQKDLNSGLQEISQKSWSQSTAKASSFDPFKGSRVKRDAHDDQVETLSRNLRKIEERKALAVARAIASVAAMAISYTTTPETPTSGGGFDLMGSIPIVGDLWSSLMNASEEEEKLLTEYRDARKQYLAVSNDVKTINQKSPYGHLNGVYVVPDAKIV